MLLIRGLWRVLVWEWNMTLPRHFLISITNANYNRRQGLTIPVNPAAERESSAESPQRLDFRAGLDYCKDCQVAARTSSRPQCQGLGEGHPLPSSHDSRRLEAGGMEDREASIIDRFPPLSAWPTSRDPSQSCAVHGSHIPCVSLRCQWGRV